MLLFNQKITFYRIDIDFFLNFSKNLELSGKQKMQKVIILKGKFIRLKNSHVFNYFFFVIFSHNNETFEQYYPKFIFTQYYPKY